MSDISCRYTSLPGTFSYKVTTGIDYFTGEPIVQCDVPVVKETYKWYINSRCKCLPKKVWCQYFMDFF